MSNKGRRFDGNVPRRVLLEQTELNYEEHWGVSSLESSVHCNDAYYYFDDSQVSVSSFAADRKVSRRNHNVNRLDILTNKSGRGG
jgi:hypothetical protein